MVSPVMDVPPPRLRVEGVSKAFGGSRALDGVSFGAWAGEVHALLGQNGSGKSTLVKILAGYHQPDAGRATVADEDLHLGSTGAARSAGIRFVHQDLGLILSASTVENVAFGRPFRRRAGLIDWGAEAARATELIQQLGYSFDVRAPVADLAMSERVGVAVARALDSIDLNELNVIVFDEPTAAMPEPEARRFFEMVHRLRRRNVAVVFISHRLDEVMDIADRVTVLRDGRVVGSREMAGLTAVELVQLIIGDVELAPARERIHHHGEPVLEVAGLSGGSIQDATFTLHAGEIVGVAGLVGSGHDGLARLLYGATRRTAGTVRLDGRDIPAGKPDRAAALGIGLVPADRKRFGALSALSVAENLVMGDAGRHARRGIVRHRAERRDVASWVRRLDVRPADPAARMFTLSGGNQQKVILARWLRRGPRVLLLDEPTQGIDIGAKAQIYDLVEQAAAGGLAVLVCSGDTEELERLCGRVFAMRQGRIVRQLSTREVSRSAIDHAILAVTSDQEYA